MFLLQIPRTCYPVALMVLFLLLLCPSILTFQFLQDSAYLEYSSVTNHLYIWLVFRSTLLEVLSFYLFIFILFRSLIRYKFSVVIGLIYPFLFQLLFSSWKQSLIPGMCGVLAGSLYHPNLLGIRKIKV